VRIDVLPDADAAALKAASIIAGEVRAAASRGRFVMAVSGGRTPWQMLRALAGEDLPWDRVHVLQVDERVAPAGDPSRNLVRPDQIHGMPVEDEDLERAAQKYAATLEQLAGSPPVLDLVHLGLGPDGHTASLIPGDPVLRVNDRDVALAGPYQGHRRMTLTYPVINRARSILWLVTGGEKAPVLPRLLAGDQTIPGGCVAQERAVMVADRAAAGQLDANKKEVRA
jgi:6-phosphogluconolactonase